VRLFKEAGGGPIVDVTGEDLGRDVRAEKKVAEETGVHVISATGHYTKPYYLDCVERLTINKLADRMVGDIKEGINDTGIRAGSSARSGLGGTSFGRPRNAYSEPQRERTSGLALRLRRTRCLSS
jgi:phosphotriesterase-related protein